MPSPRHRHGLLVFPYQKDIISLWRTPTSLAQDIFAVKSRDGKHFRSTMFFIAYFKRDGSKTSLGFQATLRANTFTTTGNLFISEPGQPGTFVAIKKNLSWKVVAQSTLLSGPTVCLEIPATKKHKAQYIAFSSRQGRSIFVARSTNTLSRFHEIDLVLRARPKQFDARKLTPLYTERIGQNILLVYSAEDQSGIPAVGALLFTLDHPSKVIWRSDFPIWQPSPKKKYSAIRFLGGFPAGKYFSLYIESPEHGVEYFPVAQYWLAPRLAPLAPIELPKRMTGIKITLDRSPANPILEPRAHYAWEAFAAFNPAALVLDDRIHLLYRAQGYDGQSVLGYAGSSDGVHIDERLQDPVFVPHRAKSVGENLPLGSGGGTGGCEDPRLVNIDDRVYLMYVAFDGSAPPGVALASISKAHFLEKRWRWTNPRLISQPGQIQKNWVLFPEKINGKFAILHGLTPTIKIDYLESLDQLGKTQFIESLSSHGGRGYIDTNRLDTWDNIVRGVGAPPLRTQYGWLVFYHGMDMRDPGKYKVGAMLLDLKHPERILRRALEPVLEPETEYENNGHKRGVVYVCGAVIKQETLFVYYGASDRTSAVATADVDVFLQDLLRNKPPTLRKMHVRKRS